MLSFVLVFFYVKPQLSSTGTLHTVDCISALLINEVSCGQSSDYSLFCFVCGCLHVLYVLAVWLRCCANESQQLDTELASLLVPHVSLSAQRCGRKNAEM